MGGLAWDAAIRWPPSPGLSHGGGKPNAVWYAVAHRERSERKEAREADETQDDGPKQVAHIRQYALPAHSLSSRICAVMR